MNKNKYVYYLKYDYDNNMVEIFLEIIRRNSDNIFKLFNFKDTSLNVSL